MRIGLVAAAAILFSASIGASTEPVTSFWLYFEDAEGHLVGDPGMDVYLVGRVREQLGKTDANGEFAVAKSLIESNRGSALLFCRPENAHCVAVLFERLDTGYDEFNLRVPPTELVDRFKVNVTP